MTMNENLPAVRTPNEVATADTDSWVQVAGAVSKLAAQIADTEFVPKGLRGSAAATAAAMLYGREVGLPPMTALNMTHVVEGKPGISAEGMRALVLAAGHELEFVETTGAVCTMRGRRRGGEHWTTVTWTVDMARAAGLAGKNNWKGYPRAMLIARATTDLCRMVFPDVIHGFRSVEELEDMRPEDGDTAPPPALTAPGTKVARKRTTTRGTRGTPPPVEARPTVAPLEGPPLPGEEGYDVPGGVSDDGPESDDSVSRETLEDTPPAPSEPVEEPVEEVPAPGATDEPEPPHILPPGSEVLHVFVPGSEEPYMCERCGLTQDDGRAFHEDPPEPRPMSRPQQRMMMGQFHTLGIADGDEGRVERLHITSVIIGRTVDTSNALTHAEASQVIDTLGRARDYNRLAELLDAIEKERSEAEG